MFSKSKSSNYNPRNIIVKSIISTFVGVGIFLALYATLSCEWFVFDEASNDHNSNDENNSNAAAKFTDDVTTYENATEKFTDRSSLPFLPSNIDPTTVQSVGLFRYQSSSTTSSTTTATSATGNITDDDDDERRIQEEPVLHRCVRYEPLFRLEMTWVFVAQICVLSGPVIAFLAWLIAMLGVNKYPTALLLFVATGVQVTSVIFSMSLCESFWECPWLLGSLADVVAAGLFFLSWLAAMCGLVVRKNPNNMDEDEDGDNMNNGDKSPPDLQIKTQLTEDSEDTNYDDNNSFRSGPFCGMMVGDDEESQIPSFGADDSSSSVIVLDDDELSSKNNQRRRSRSRPVSMSHSSRSGSVRDMIKRINSKRAQAQTTTNAPTPAAAHHEENNFRSSVMLSEEDVIS